MKTIAVIFGGQSTEHDVSIVTALSSIIKPLKVSKNYEVIPVYITKEGTWLWDDKLTDITTYQTGEVEQVIRKNSHVHLLFDNGLTLVKSSQFAGRKIYKKIDVVFPAMHGTHGEDGELMGLLQMANVPFIGCDMRSSAIAMDKVLSKQIIEANGLPTAKYEYLFRDAYTVEPKKTVDELAKSLRFPMFVKPAHLGSSIGISRATNTYELTNAIELAAHYDDKVLVEEEVQNLIEVTLPIIGNDELKPALLERPIKLKDGVFDFDSKYIGNGGKNGAKTGGKRGVQGYSEIPAKIDKTLYNSAIELGKDAYRALECSGIARIDMLIDKKTGIVYFNEANPLPGGLYAHNWHAAGMSNRELVEELIYLAEQLHKKRQRISTTFETSFLRKF